MNIFIPQSYEVPLKVALIDEDNTALTAKISERISTSFALTDVTEVEITSALANNKVDYALIIRAGFTEKFLRGQDAYLEGYGISGQNVSLGLQNIINSFLRSTQALALACNGDEQSFVNSLATFATKASITHAHTAEVSHSRTIGVLGFLVQFMIYTSVMTTGLILDEKSNGSLYRILSSPTNMRQYMSGHLLSSLSVAVAQVVSIFVFLKYAMGVYFAGSFWSLLFIYVVYAVVCMSMGLLITMYCSNPRQAYVAVIMMATPLVMLGGAYWPRNFMPDVLIRISNLLPTTWVIEASKKLVAGGTLLSVTNELLILLAFAAVFFFGGVLRKVDISK